MLNIELTWEIEENNTVETYIYKAVEEALNYENVKCDVTLSMVVTDNAHIKELNNTHRNIDRETDVLSFPGYEKEEWEEIKNKKDMAYIGDIVISKEKVEEQALEYENSFEREFCYLTVHGMLHLMGYDHMEDEDKKVMREKEEEIMSKLGLTR